MKRIFCLLIVLALSACDVGGNGSTTEATNTPAPIVEWGNLVNVANTYEYTAVPISIEDAIAFGQVGATQDAICTLMWETATRVIAYCRNTISEGQWPPTCTVNELSGHTYCPDVGPLTWYALRAMGPSRSLTLAEAELADEIRRQTYCSAPRLDGSGNPCTIL